MVTTKAITADELEQMDLGDGRYELIHGELVEMTPAGGEHGAVGMDFGAHVWNFVRERRLGKVYNADTGFRLGPKLILVPDVAFVRADRVPPASEHRKILRFAPDLVVEVASPTDRPGAIAAKIADWLDAGVRLLWLVHPPARTVTVYAPGRPERVLREGDVIDGEDVLPGFRLAVAELFA